MAQQYEYLVIEPTYVCPHCGRKAFVANARWVSRNVLLGFCLWCERQGEVAIPDDLPELGEGAAPDLGSVSPKEEWILTGPPKVEYDVGEGD